MTEQTKSKILAPADIYKVLKSAHSNGRLEDNLAQIAREIAKLDPAYLARIEQMKAESSNAVWVEVPKSVSDAIHKAALPWSGYGLSQQTQMMWDAFIEAAPACPKPSKNPKKVAVPALLTETMFKIAKPFHGSSNFDVVQAMWEAMLITAGVDASVFSKAKEAAKAQDEAELPAQSVTSGVQIRKLEWVLENEFWKCTTHHDYHIECWWETDFPKTPRDPNDPHYFVINDDDDERYGTIEEAMEAAQTLYEAAANSYLVTPVAALSDDEKFKAGREKGLREGAKIASDFVWKLYKHRDGITTSHDYEKVREEILEQIDHSTNEEELNASIAPR